MEFDLDLAVKQSSENPVFYVQYAHARLAGILARAAEQGLTPEGGDVSLLTAAHELALVREMMQLSDVIESVATTFEPQLLPHYAMEGKSYLTIAIGCTGGRHRSVAVVEELARRMEVRGIDARVVHRDLPR